MTRQPNIQEAIGLKSTQKVVMLAFPDAQILDITGPMEIFSRTARWLKDHGRVSELCYDLSIVAKDKGPIRTSSGMQILADYSLDDRVEADTILISGGIGFRQAISDESTLEWLKENLSKVKRVGSVCTGSFVLAELGLLEGKRATTHWAYCEEMHKNFPNVEVDSDAIYVKQGNIYTSAGVTSGMDMALAMVEEDWGQAVALAIAQEMVLYLKRPGGQSQFSPLLRTQQSETERLQQLILWATENPAEDLSVQALAERASMSPRNFARRFLKETQLTPAKYVEQIRVECARRKLENTQEKLERIARDSGFKTAEIMRRSFMRTLGITPNQYRERFKGGVLS